MKFQKIVLLLGAFLLLSGFHFLTDEEYNNIQKGYEKQIESLKDEHGKEVKSIKEVHQKDLGEAEKISNEQKSKISTLEDENKKLKSEIHGLRVNLPKMKKALELAVASGDDIEIYKRAKAIEKNFPDSKEAIVAREYSKKSYKVLEDKYYKNSSDLKVKKGKNGRSLWYYDRKIEHRLTTIPAFLYIARNKGGEPVLKFRVQSADPSNSLTRGFILSGDKGSYEIIPEKKDLKERKITGGKWIWTEKTINDEEKSMLIDLIYSSKPYMKLIKKGMNETIPLGKGVRNSMVRVLNGYNALQEFHKVQQQ